MTSKRESKSTQTGTGYLVFSALCIVIAGSGLVSHVAGDGLPTEQWSVWPRFSY